VSVACHDLAVDGLELVDHDAQLCVECNPRRPSKGGFLSGFRAKVSGLVGTNSKCFFAEASFFFSVNSVEGPVHGTRVTFPDQTLTP